MTAEDASTPGAGVEFDHLVLTRFSAVFGDGVPPADPAWLDYRLGFFIDACLPSMLSQTVRDFRWLVWFDDRCPDDFRADVEQLAAEGGFEPIWTHESFWQDLTPQVVARSTRPWLVTTRHDSDDALARDFIESVQREVRPVDRLVIDFPVGLQLDRSGAVYADHLRSNHFVSLLERRTEAPPVTVFVSEHPKLRRHAPIRRVVTEPMWLEVLHGSNVSNDLRGERVDPSVVASRFDIPLGYRADVDPQTLRRERRERSRAMWRTRLTNPHAALTWTRAVVDRARGTLTVARSAGQTLGERLQTRSRL